MQEQLYTWIADFTMQGRLAYLSHQETLTMFERVLARAGVELVFSAGFNPRPHLSLPLPRSVGVQSEAERICAIVRYETKPAAESLRKTVEAQLPEGCTILSCELAEGKVTFHPAGYRLQFALADTVEPAVLAHLQASIARQQSGEPVVIQRYLAKKDSIKPLDVSAYLETAELADHLINVRCRVSPEGTVRVDELMQWLQLRPDHLCEPVRRMEIYWN